MPTEAIVPNWQWSNQGWINQSGSGLNLHESVDDGWQSLDNDLTYIQCTNESIADNELILTIAGPQASGPFFSLETWIRARRVGGSFPPSLHWRLQSETGSTDYPFHFTSGNVVVSSSSYVDYSWTISGEWNQEDLAWARLRLWNPTSNSTLRITTIEIRLDIPTGPSVYGFEALYEQQPPLRLPKRYFVYPY